MVSHLSENQLNLDNDTIHEKLEVGSMVEVLSKNAEPKYGLIRWIGLTPNANGPVAGLELVGYRYFNRNIKRSVYCQYG